MTIELKPGGLLIAIEGIDGAGKTTLARNLATTLEAAGARVKSSKEPTNGHWGTQLRQSAATGRLSADEEAELLIRDRHEHVETLIAPALARGEIVILDRYFPSMVAYQGAAGLPLDALLERNAFAPRPDVLLLLDLPPPTGLARIRARGDAPNHFETQDNLERCRAIFNALQLPGKQVLDASANADSVLRQALTIVIAALAERLSNGTHTDAGKAALDLLSAGRPA
ncbi:dTMP kinase [Xanthomonas vesicatoria]|uniref:Thymidylate kinase n=1 Tax=Xanthomonas vesicatoria TaxID=56460 RepID=A0AAJ0J2H1_9XANT|nr:dTMP kinase [Xanthomonas vesicatoria]APO95522.1 dTMP kinase [Xanthomonas vesicatoria]KHM96043.1 thymidylate kinase [Xanthomonas vesicatoria]KHM98519.1 thymidylate kinase [Xanthomonas vesicatoria]MCC8617619.1 dTMP kinase [Xanthomonas vesicatoria]MCC8622174.1 dTMP kinase [Xanthomonas vesicatoria]